MAEWMTLKTLFETIKDGDERGWGEEFDLIRTEHGSHVRALTGSILREGIRKPILIGDDGRLWDGHHRVYVAFMLGFPAIAVEYARDMKDA